MHVAYVMTGSIFSSSLLTARGHSKVWETRTMYTRDNDDDDGDDDDVCSVV